MRRIYFLAPNIRNDAPNSFGDTRVKQYEDVIEIGKLLVMVDIPKERIDSMSRLIIKHHPTAQFEGIEPLLPPNYV